MALAQTRIFPWFFDPDDNKMTIDARWFRHLGIADTADTISAETFFGFVHPDDRAMLLDAFTRQLSGALDDKRYSYRLRHGDGAWEWSKPNRSTWAGATTVRPAAWSESARASRATKPSKTP